MKRPEIVPATAGHFSDLGESMKRSGRAIAAVLDGQTIGVAGYYLDKGRIVVYSTITAQLRGHRRTIVHGAHIVMGMIQSVQAPAHAIAADVDGAETLLEHFGFERSDGDVYERAPTWRRLVH